MRTHATIADSPVPPPRVYFNTIASQCNAVSLYKIMPIEPRQSPRISANKLAEYMTCTPARRRRIIEHAKYPSEFIALRYNAFYDIALAYAKSNPLDEEIITSGIDSLRAQEPRTDWEADNIQLNIDLLQNLLDLPDLIAIEDYNAASTGDQIQVISIEGVEISVRPELLLRQEIRGQSILGGLKFYLPKTFPLNDVSGTYLAGLIHWYLEVEFPEETVDYRHCFVMDVPNGTIFTAPRAYTRRRADIAAACEEIASRWNGI